MSGGHMKIIAIESTGLSCNDDRTVSLHAWVDEAIAAGADVQLLAEDAVPGLDYTTLQSRCLNLARAHPDYNVFYGAYDTLGQGAITALQTTGLYDESKIVLGADGKAEFLNDMRQGGMAKATVAMPFIHVWFDMDNLNRLFNGEPLYWVGQGEPSMDFTHLIVPDNVPATGEYQVDWDVEGLFRAMWGV
jgi:ABC-type sugar transport system substrate-binding protein